MSLADAVGPIHCESMRTGVFVLTTEVLPFGCCSMLCTTTQEHGGVLTVEIPRGGGLYKWDMPLSIHTYVHTRTNVHIYACVFV